MWVSELSVKLDTRNSLETVHILQDSGMFSDENQVFKLSFECYHGSWYKEIIFKVINVNCLTPNDHLQILEGWRQGYLPLVQAGKSVITLHSFSQEVKDKQEQIWSHCRLTWQLPYPLFPQKVSLVLLWVLEYSADAELPKKKGIYEGFDHIPPSQFKGQGHAKAFSWFRDRMNRQIFRLYSDILLLCSNSQYWFINTSSTFILAFYVKFFIVSEELWKICSCSIFLLFIHLGIIFFIFTSILCPLGIRESYPWQ